MLDRIFEGIAEEKAVGGAANIFVSPNGSDTNNGTLLSPFKSIAKAFKAVTTSRSRVILAPGTYVETASLTWPSVNGTSLNGNGAGECIVTAPGATQIISIDPLAASGTWTAILSNITISAEDQVGLQVNNTNVGKRINLFLTKTTFEAGGDSVGSSIDINRAGASSNAIRVYADGEGTTIEGLVTVITESTDDRFRFKGYRLIGGLTVVGAVACEVTLINSGILTSGLTVDGANKLTNVHCWYETDANPNVFTVFADAYATY
ncbi:DUF1565 domain-containing protein [Candidatus Dojkabacteria bacterium]|jgi:hypothetical protein|nr:DUF1565 domain-containing protein [Candidatus Dojkabacteria bacterium]